MPSVPVSANTRSSQRATTSGRHRTLSTTPGRSFFICTGVTKTSSAPADCNRSRTWPIVSPGTSSRFVSSITTCSVSAQTLAVPMKIRSTLARSGNVFVPQPQPIASMVIAGIGPKLSARVFAIAAPVGVVSSDSIGISASGIPLRISAVPGAGIGQIP